MNDSSIQGAAQQLPTLGNEQLFKQNSFVFDATKTYDASESLHLNSNFGQDQQLSESQTPTSPNVSPNTVPFMKNQYIMNAQSSSRRYKRVTASNHVKQSADGNHFEIKLSQLEKEDIDTMRPSHSQEIHRSNAHSENRSRSQAPSGSASKPGERSRSHASKMSCKLKFSYPDDQSRISTKMSKYDQPMRQTRDFSKALSIFSIKRESTTDFDRTSQILTARVASTRRVDRNRINDKQLRVISQSSESPIVCQSRGMHSKMSNNLQASQMSQTKSPQMFVGQSFSHESFGQNTPHPGEDRVKQSTEVAADEHRPMIQIYSKPALKSKKQDKAVNKTTADARVSNIFFKSKKVKKEKKEKPNNTTRQVKEDDLRLDSAFTMYGTESSPMLNMRGGGPNMNASQDMKPKRGRQLSSRNSVESPDSRPQSSAPMKQVKGDISSIMNQHNKEDCLDSPKNAKKKNTKSQNDLNMNGQNETEFSVNGRKQVVSGVSTNQTMQEMGGLIISREVNKQMHPKLLKQQEKLQSVQKPEQTSKVVQPSPRFSGTKGLNQKYHSFSKNNNLRRTSKPPAMPVNVAKQNNVYSRQSRQSTSPPMPIDQRYRLNPKEHPYLRSSKNSKRSSTRGSVFNRQSKATSDGSIFLSAEQNNNNQVIRNRSTLSRGLALSRSPQRINPNEKLFTMSGPFNPLLNCGCTGKGVQRDSLTITRVVERQDRVPPPPVMSENYDTNDQFESEYEVISNHKKDSQKLSLEFQKNQIFNQPYQTYYENVTDSEQDTKEIILNQAETDRHNRESYQKTDNTDRFANHFHHFNDVQPNYRLKQRNSSYQFDSFNNYNEKSMAQEQMLIMHNVSPKFKRDSIDKSDEYHQQTGPNDPNEFHLPAPPEEIMTKCNYNSPEHEIVREVVGMSIQPTKDKKINRSQQHELHEQSTMVENKMKFDSSKRNPSDEQPNQLPLQQVQSLEGSQRKEMYKIYSNEDRLSDEDDDDAPENLINEEENELKQGSVICKEQIIPLDEDTQGQAELILSQSGVECDSPMKKQINNSILEKESSIEKNDTNIYDKEDIYEEEEQVVNEKQDYYDKLDELNLQDNNMYEKQDSFEDIPNENQHDQIEEEHQQDTIVEKEDEIDHESPEPTYKETFNNSMEKSDNSKYSHQGKPKNALQQDLDYFDSNQVGNEQQVTIDPEQTNESIESPERKVPTDEKVNDEEGNPNTDGDKSNTSSQLHHLKKSFQYGIEDVKGDSSQLLNLNISKHDQSIRDAPLCNSIKVPNPETEVNMLSEIRCKKATESMEKHGVDSSLNEVMKMFKDTEKKSKGNFGWNKAVQHTTIRLNDVVEEANKIDRARHVRNASKMSMRQSISKNKLLADYSRFGVRQSQQIMNFNERMHQLQREQFGNRFGSKVSPRGLHSKQHSIASNYMQSKTALSKFGGVDQFLGKRKAIPGMLTQRNPLAMSRQGLLNKSINKSINMNQWDMQSQYSSSKHLGARKRNANLKGVMKTQINLMDSYNGNGQANTSLYSHVMHAKKKSKDFNLQKIRQSINQKPTGNPAYKKRVEKKKEMPFQLGNGPHDHLVCQGTLLRYKPGIEKDFVHRWVQMTKQDFRYFENSLKAEGCLKAERLILMAKFSGQQASLNTSQNIQCGSAVPLISIPTQAIEKAYRLDAADFQVPNNRNKMEQKDLYKHLFEIKLKCKYDDLRYYKEEIKANMDTISMNSPLRSNNNKSRSNLSRNTKSISSYYASPIPKKKNMFVKKFSKSPNLIRDQISQNSFNRNIIKHKKSHSRQLDDLKDLNSAVVNKVKIKLNKTIKRRPEGTPDKDMSPSNHDLGLSSVERDCSKPPNGKEPFYRSRSQAMLTNDQKCTERNLMADPREPTNQDMGTQPITQRVSLSKTKSSNLHSDKGCTILTQKQQFKLNGRKKSAAALFSKSKFGKIKTGSQKTAQSDAHVLSFGQSIGDNNSAYEGKSQKLHIRSPSKGSNDILRKVVPGQLMPMPLSKSRSSSKFFRSPSKDDLNGSQERPKQYNIQLSQGKARTKSQLRECSSQQIQYNDLLQIPKTQSNGGLLGKYSKIQDAINSNNEKGGGHNQDKRSQSKIIQICASNRSLEFNKSKYTDDTPAPSEKNQQQKWSQRQQMWYMEERRIIFSAKSQEQVNQWVRTINKFVQEQGNILQMPLDLASEQLSAFGQSKMSEKKTTKVKKIKKKKGTERQILKGLKQFNKGQKRQINFMVSQQY